ncbi:hypothetical protein BUALT_Bualt03G0038500 [Buddleja alternifolia]|uniref:HSF-type DNA-binding domain-containing protein n=1 Tax=Buddleja alternifolia TaxID=168488 RepID=A0AAV6XR19_9LAMI|nr:hypothetical protein BUALT_Bualt03G0038500 [Buddleja alternifolia]
MNFEIETAKMEKSSVTENAGGNGGERGGGDAKWVSSPPPFLVKIYEMVDDIETNSIISWSSTGTSFIVWDYIKFSAEILPKYFKTTIFSSFVYQLNNYGFRKISSERYEYVNQWFQLGKKHLLRNMKRRNQNQKPQPTKKRGRFNLEHDNAMNVTMERKLECLLTEQNDMKEQIENLKQNQKKMEDQLENLEINMRVPEPKDEKMDIAVFLKHYMQYLREKKDEANGDNSKKLRLDGPTSTESSMDLTNKVEIPTQKLFSSTDDSGSSVQEQNVKKATEITEHCPFWKKMLEYDGFVLNEQKGDLDAHHKAIMELDEMQASNMAIQTENLMANSPSDPGMEEEEDGHLELWT